MSTICQLHADLREGDHAEFTLLERKRRSEKVEGNVLFATLEPCAPGARHFPKLGCAERIVNARIGKVYIGIEDPDPTVCRKGIQHLLDNGVEVEMYPRDLQAVIEECNKEFLGAAYERARIAEEEETSEEILLSKTELAVPLADIDEMDSNSLRKFMAKAHFADVDTQKGLQDLLKLGIIGIVEEGGKSKYVPTGQGLLLFGKRPEVIYNSEGVAVEASYSSSRCYL